MALRAPTTEELFVSCPLICLFFGESRRKTPSKRIEFVFLIGNSIRSTLFPLLLIVFVWCWWCWPEDDFYSHLHRTNTDDHRWTKFSSRKPFSHFSAFVSIGNLWWGSAWPLLIYAPRINNGKCSGLMWASSWKNSSCRWLILSSLGMFFFPLSSLSLSRLLCWLIVRSQRQQHWLTCNTRITGTTEHTHTQTHISNSQGKRRQNSWSERSMDKKPSLSLELFSVLLICLLCSFSSQRLQSLSMTSVDLCAMYKPWHVQQEIVSTIMDEFWEEVWFARLLLLPLLFFFFFLIFFVFEQNQEIFTVSSCTQRESDVLNLVFLLPACHRCFETPLPSVWTGWRRETSRSPTSIAHGSIIGARITEKPGEFYQKYLFAVLFLDRSNPSGNHADAQWSEVRHSLSFVLLRLISIRL